MAPLSCSDTGGTLRANHGEFVMPSVKSMMTWLASIIGVAVSDGLAAILGMNLGVASGNTSPVWPATGIAIAAVYLGGYRVAPGVWQGGLAFEMWTGAPWIVCVGAPIANILEPLIAVDLMRRFCLSISATCCDKTARRRRNSGSRLWMQKGATV